MSNKFRQVVGPSILTIGLVFSAGQVDADKPETGVKVQNTQTHQDAKIEHQLVPLEKKLETIQIELEQIESALSNEEALTEVAVEKYKDELEILLNRLSAAENHFNAVTKKSAKDSSVAVDIDQLIEEMHENIADTQAELDSVSSVVPDGLEPAKHPAFEVGSTAIIEASHMEGMFGAEATIVGAYDTIAYSVSFTPTDGGERVTNHKWVIHEEIEEAGKAPLKPGTEVTLDADHMEGMDGATAEIETAVKTTVYMVDFVPTTGGEKVTNHKWLIESELSDK